MKYMSHMLLVVVTKWDTISSVYERENSQRLFQIWEYRCGREKTLGQHGCS